MHNLGLGGIEFSPAHTVDEHRPRGYKIPEIIIDQNNTLDLEIPNNSNYSEIAPISQSIEFDGDSRDAIKADKEIKNETKQPENSFNDMWNSDLWQESTFKQMHDPKHRHPRHHGMFKL